MKIKKARGYVSSRKIDGSIVPQSIQNLVIRDFCTKNNLLYLLSSIEYKMEKSFLILQKTLSEIKSIDGIVMYSIYQVPFNDNDRAKILNHIVKKSKFISFALENITIKKKKDIENFEQIYKLSQMIKFCPTKLNE